MPISRMTPLAVVVPLLIGCTLAPLVPGDRSPVARALPEGMRMSDYVERGPLGGTITVRMKLASLGAHTSPDGKLYDRSGRPITFFHHYQGGARIADAMLREWYEQLEELKRTSTVIEIHRDHRLPPAV